MDVVLRHALALAGLAIATQAAAQITFYEHSNFRGESFTTQQPIGNMERQGFNNRASSAIVRGEAWEVCDAPGFSGRCVILRPGEYPSLGGLGLNDSVTSARTEADRNARVAPPVGPGPAQATLYGRENFQGRSMTIDRPVGDLERFDFGDRASSAVVQGGSWEFCDDARFGGRCVILRPGRYPSLAAMGLDNRVSSLRVAGAAPAPAPAPVAGQITFYGRADFEGRSITVDRPVGDLERFGFADRASSLVVTGTPWEVCDDVRFGGRCVVLRPGRYPSLASIGLDNRISSVRAAGGPRADDGRYAPAPAAAYDYRRRGEERLYQANVQSVRAVVGTPEQRCWVEREQVVQGRSSNAPGAVAGAVVGGIIGHQVASGRKQDLATAIGALAGAAVGSQVGGGQQAVTQDVQRCASVPRQAPEYYDVTYYFRGQEHRVQMTADPGPTVTVNERGEPRE